MDPQTCLQGLQRSELILRIKSPKPLTREKQEALTFSLERNQDCSMDSIRYQLCAVRKFRLFNVIDDYNREAISKAADFSLPTERVIRELKQMISWGGKPRNLSCDNGPQYVSASFRIG